MLRYGTRGCFVISIFRVLLYVGYTYLLLRVSDFELNFTGVFEFSFSIQLFTLANLQQGKSKLRLNKIKVKMPF